MNYLLSPDERGPLNLSVWQLVVWSLGLCYFGVVFAVPLYEFAYSPDFVIYGMNFLNFLC